MPLLKCSLPTERGIKALQINDVLGQPIMLSIFTCKKINMPATKPFQMCVKKLSQCLLAPFLPLPLFLVSSLRNPKNSLIGLHGSRRIELILSHKTFANRSRFTILFFPLCPLTPFQKVTSFSAVNQHKPSLLLRTVRSLGYRQHSSLCPPTEGLMSPFHNAPHSIPLISYWELSLTV